MHAAALPGRLVRPVALLLVPSLALLAAQVTEPARLVADGDTALVRFEVRARGGDALPARLTFVPLDGAPAAPFTVLDAAPDELAVRGDVVYSRSGAGTLAVPPGRYAIVASHGPEWSLARHEEELVADETHDLRFELEHEVETPGWASGDFHLHTLTHSGHGDANLRERVLSFLGEDLDFAVATDHDHHTDYRPTMAALGVGDAFLAVTGNEVSTPIGHFNAFPLDPAAAPVDSSLADANALFTLIRAQRGEDGTAPVIQLNHPRMAGIDYFGHAELDAVTGRSASPRWSRDFDAIEVLNENSALGYRDPVLDDAAVPGHAHSVLRDWFHLLDLGERYAATGNSDSHHVRAVVAGYPRNYVRCDGAPTAARIAAAVRERALYTTTGPLLDVSIGGASIGSSTTAEDGHAVLSVRVRAASWIDCDRVRVFVNGAEVATLPVPDGRAPVRLEREHELCFLRACGRHGGDPAAHGPARDAWVVVVVEGDDALAPVLGPDCRPLAIANPVWIDADGDGRWTSPDARIAAELAAQGTPAIAEEWFDTLDPREQALALAHVERGPFAAVLLERAFASPRLEVLRAAARALERTRVSVNLPGVREAWTDHPEDPFLGALLLRAQLRAYPELAGAGLAAYAQHFGEAGLRRHAGEILPLLPTAPELRWSVLGPEPTAPELLARPAPPPGDVGDGSGPGWTPLEPAPGTRYVDLVGLGGAETEHCLVWAQTYLRARTPGDVLVAFGSDDGGRVWLDGELVHEDRARKSANPMEALLTLPLDGTWKRVVVEVENATGGFGFYLRPLAADVESAARER